MRSALRLERFPIPGPAAQASVPGVYAWAVTVAPVAWGHNRIPVLAKIAAAFAPIFLLGGVVIERRWGGRGRILSLWGFTLSCAAAWSSAPTVVAPLLSDGVRTAAGMLGWSVFAFAFAGPPLGKGAVVRLADNSPLGARRDLPRGDMAYVAAGALLAATTQLFGWQVAPTERALLMRLITLAAGLAILGAWAGVAIARHEVRDVGAPRARLRAALVPIILLIMLAAFGVLGRFSSEWTRVGWGAASSLWRA